MPTEPMISIRGLKKRFGDVTVLRDISPEVGKGEVVALIGPRAPASPPCCAASTC